MEVNFAHDYQENIEPSIDRGEDFLEINQSETIIAIGTHIC